ncbi:MAG: S16 family serine protease, partial [Limisphaerales bacterium]
EKTLAALRAGIKTVIYPKLNEKDLPDIPEEVKEKIKLIPVETVDDAIAIAFEKQVKPAKKKQKREKMLDSWRNRRSNHSAEARASLS